MLEHLKRAIEFTHINVGRNGLPLLGFADWNDTVNLPEGAESIFIANLYGKALIEMIDIMEYIGDSESALKYKDYYESMKKIVNEKCWDGQWYIRYFDHNGNMLGSKENKHGKIYTNAQSWSILSGFAPPDRAKEALESVNRLLNTSKGIKLSFPGYEKYDP